jgi:2-polyprenyl-3-methyl-5-hydroxy-6-metoxy-1,4-benzoquinol methylase
MKRHLMKNSQELVWTRALVEEFWNFQSQFPSNYFAHQYGEALSRYLRKKITDVGEILDLGCGNGDLLPYLSNGKRNLWGADLSDSSIKNANDRCKNNPGFVGAIKTSSLIALSKQIYAITVTEVIEHLYDNDLERLITDVKFLLKPNGVVVFTTPNNEDLSLSYAYCPVSRKYFHRWQHVRSWDRFTISDDLSSSGFDLVLCVETNLNRWNRYKGKKLRTALSNSISKMTKTNPHLIVLARLR